MEQYEKAKMEIIDIKDDVILTSVDCNKDYKCDYELPFVPN